MGARAWLAEGLSKKSAIHAATPVPTLAANQLPPPFVRLLHMKELRGDQKKLHVAKQSSNSKQASCRMCIT
jgi:hypothetical protein